MIYNMLINLIFIYFVSLAFNASSKRNRNILGQDKSALSTVKDQYFRPKVISYHYRPVYGASIHGKRNSGVIKDHRPAATAHVTNLIPGSPFLHDVLRDIVGDRGECPPPAAAMEWAESGHSGRRAVAVVDLGDAERWLRPLHGRARAPLLLWRAPVESTRGCAPHWLEGNRGYVLAAKRMYRVIQFLTHDTQEAVYSEAYSIITKHSHRELQLNSLAPVVIAATDWSKNSILANEALHFLRQRHQSFRGMVVWKMQSNRWAYTLCYLFIPQGKHPSEARYSCIKYINTSKQALRDATDLVKWQQKNLGGLFVTTYAYPTEEYQTANYSDRNVVGLRIGPEYRQMYEIQNRINLNWYPKATTISSKLDTADDYSRVGSVITKYLLLGKIDMDNTYIRGSDNSLLFSIPATATWLKLLIIVPRASFLPSWSLPIRVFGGWLWAALLSCVVAYALAWRVVARESLAGSVVAALRAFSSCGGAAQERVFTTPQRLQLAGALLGSAVVIVATYQQQLFSLLYHPESFPEINTFSQLADSKMKIFLYSIEGEASLLPNPEIFSEQELESRMRVFHLPHRYMNQDDLPDLIRNKEKFGWVLPQFVWENMEKLLRFSIIMRSMDTYLDKVLMFKHTRRNWPWVETVNTILLHIHSSGIDQFWKGDYAMKNEVVFRSVEKNGTFFWTNESEDLNSTRPKKLKVEDILASLQLLAMGQAVSLSVFLLEILFQKIQLKTSISKIIIWRRF